MAQSKSFMNRVAEAREGIPMVSPQEAQQRMQDEPNTLMLDVRDSEQIRESGAIPGIHHASLGTLLYKADQNMPENYRDAAFSDQERPIIVTCGVGAMASVAARELTDMGYSNVSILEGGTQGWKDAGLPTEPFGQG